MRTTFRLGCILTFFALFLFNSCQNESIEETQSQEETLVPNSPLADLMRSTASNDGAVDDILDNSSCFTVHLPVTIIANGITVTIESLDDLEVLEEIFNEFNEDDDSLEFLFPITIVLNDYEEVVIENQDALEAYVQECLSQQDDAVIECVDFVYPLSFSIYNTDFQVIDNVTVNNDEELYEFLEGLNDGAQDGVVLASLDFPVSLIYADGTTVEVMDNEALEAAINAAEDACDQNNTPCTEDAVAAALLECYWTIENYPGEDDNYDNYEFYFSEDGTFEVVYGDTTQAIGGAWEMSTSASGLPEIIISNLNSNEELEGTWIVVACEDDAFHIEYLDPSGQSITFDFVQECEDNLGCSAQELASYLQECKWWSGTDVLTNDLNGPYFFNEDGTVSVGSSNGSNIQGTWNVSVNNEGTYLNLNLPQPYGPISLDWKVVECDVDRVELWSDGNYMVLEQDCQSEYDCEDLQANIGDACTDPSTGMSGILNENCECEVEDTCNYSYNEISQFLQECLVLGAVYEEDQFVSYVSFYFNTGNIFYAFDGTGVDDQQGDWVLSENGDEITLLLGTYDSNLLEGYWNYEGCNGTQLIFTLDNKIIKFEQDCSNDPYQCFENATVTICDEDSDPTDGIATFDLGAIYDNCSTNDLVVSFHETETDAYVNVNALPSPYTNVVAGTQTIYARVEMINHPLMYHIYSINLVVQDCTNACSEDQVDAILQECYWIPTSVGGSNDYIGFAFQFNSNQDLILEGGGTSSVGTWMTFGNSGQNTILEISQLEGNMQVFNGQWTVVECSEFQMIFTSSNNTEMVLDRECD